jgi:hypothetical protein
MEATEGQILGDDDPVDDDSLIDDHACTCGGCIESLTLPFVERHSEQHTSLRFGENERHPKVLVNGVPVEERCYEAIGGEHGRAWCFRPNDWGRIKHTCRTCGQYACIEVKTGRVEIAWGE